MGPQKITADLAIVGAGLAGLRAALAAQEHLERIAIITKGPLFQSGSTFVNRNGRWGITFATSDRERETLFTTVQQVSKGTNDPALSRILVDGSFRAFEELLEWGVAFPRDKEGRVQRVSPCFCPLPLAAIVCDANQVGRILARRLDLSRLTICEYSQAREILVDNGACHGVLCRDRDKEFLVQAPAVILACGGNAASFSRHIADPILTGDGYALAEKAGLTLANMHFQQRVWADIDPDAPRFSVSSFFDGQHFFHTAAGNSIELPPADKKLVSSRRLHVPISNLQEDRKFDDLLLRHLSPASCSAIHVHSRKTGRLVNRIYPHVQASNGGIQIGLHGETSITGLFAAGEVTTGMHGGDRVGGMMIANCLVIGRRAAEAACNFLKIKTNRAE